MMKKVEIKQVELCKIAACSVGWWLMADAGLF
jgi:hypothetical protein